MTLAKLSAVIFAGALSFGASLPAVAASPGTDAFLANATANVDFLDRSSRMALTNTKNARLREFAHDQAREQTLAANAIYDATTGAKQFVADASQDGPVQTGRSVAVDAAPMPRVADSRLPVGQEDLDQLEGLAGTDFDDFYKAKQRDAMTQIAADYQSYLANGDDPKLRAIAQHELPLVKRRLANLAKM